MSLTIHRIEPLLIRLPALLGYTKRYAGRVGIGQHA
jgi:hypothetical protein